MGYNVNALAFDNNNHLYAGGGFTRAGGNTANYIAKSELEIDIRFSINLYTNGKLVYPDYISNVTIGLNVTSNNTPYSQSVLY